MFLMMLILKILIIQANRILALQLSSLLLLIPALAVLAGLGSGLLDPVVFVVVREVLLVHNELRVFLVIALRLIDLLQINILHEGDHFLNVLADLLLVTLDVFYILPQRVDQLHQDVCLRLLLVVAADLIGNLRELQGIRSEFPVS